MILSGCIQACTNLPNDIPNRRPNIIYAGMPLTSTQISPSTIVIVAVVVAVVAAAVHTAAAVASANLLVGQGTAGFSDTLGQLVLKGHMPNTYIYTNT